MNARTSMVVVLKDGESCAESSNGTTAMHQGQRVGAPNLMVMKDCINNVQVDDRTRTVAAIRRNLSVSRYPALLRAARPRPGRFPG